jgi:phenylalanyl-tRNA synthetase alpha chain
MEEGPPMSDESQAAPAPATAPEGGQESPALMALLEAMKTMAPSAREALAAVADLKALDELRINLLGKKGRLAEFNRQMGELSPAEKPIAGRILNLHKAEIMALFKARQEELEAAALNARLTAEGVDVTLPGLRLDRGSLHPVALVTNQIAEIFLNMGFQLRYGPEVETEWFNFDALNVPRDHPARDMQDTLYVDRGLVLRTHTSPTQVRNMLDLTPPMAVITTGKVYRHDSDATHSPMFHQMEGFAVAEGISFGHLKSVLHDFLRALFGQDVRIRFRPSFFPFTEPSAEVDIWSAAHNRWMEVLGSGMIHPNVLRAGGIDPERYTGFAFGLGIDRLAMVKFGIPDLRLLFENDVRFLRQFEGQENAR